MAPSKHPSGGNTPAVSEFELHEYQKIAQFRDLVLSGQHARIKVAPSAIGRHGTVSNATATPANGGNAAVVNGLRTENLQSFKKNARNPAVTAGGNPTVGAARNEFNPVLLQKSDDLIRAELQLRRQRLENSLKEQRENRKAVAKASASFSDSSHELDIPDILAKARTLVQATAPPPVPADSPKAANVSDASDSFDDSTFYSSQHDSPLRSPVSPRIPTTTAQDVEMHDASNSSQEDADGYSPTQNFVAPSLANHPPPPQTQIPSGPSSSRPVQIPMPSYVPGLNPQYQGGFIPGPSHSGGALQTPGRPRPRNEVDAQVISSEDSAAASSGDSGNNSDQPADLSRVQNSRQQVSASDLARQASPFVRGHNLSPYAPQPAHVSSLALGGPRVVPDTIHSIQPGAPAPVAALRQEHTVITSPESSPQTDKAGKRKTKKKNKRRGGDGRHNDAPTSPEIKPEPRSPSPLTAPRFNHPQKRQRQAQPQQPQRELIYEEPRIERTASRAHQGLQPAAPVQVARDPVGWERVYDPYTHGESQPVASYAYREERPLIYHERRFEEQPGQYIQRPASPGYATSYSLREPQPMRSATYSAAQQTHRHISAYPVDGRMSVRPYPDRARSRSPVMASDREPTMAPPVAPPPGQSTAPTGRIVVDQYGREYIEPPRPSASGRQSVMPPARPRESEVIYERPSVRPSSRMLGPDMFEENGVIYRRASPAMSSRRVVTQPGYGSEYRGYRDREYSTLPMAAPQEYFQYRGAPSRIPDDFSQDQGPRASTALPAEPIPYYSRPESTRPEIQARQYPSGVHPEARAAGMAPMVREYSVRPSEAELPRREYSVRPVERFYERPAPREGEVMYIERPRMQEVVYTDDGRGPVYQ